MDESGFMLQPVRRRTWSPRGQTPVQSAWDRHDRLTVIGAVTLSPRRQRLGFYFQVLSDNARTDEFEWFLEQMHRHYRHQVTLVWDRYSAHRSAAKRFQQAHPDWFDVEWLPGYAPELNPVEQAWNHTKHAELPNFIPKHVDHLERKVTTTMKKNSKNQKLLRSFFKYCKLTL